MRISDWSSDVCSSDRRVDELVHGSGGQPSEAVRQVSRTLGSAGATDDLIGGVLTGLVDTLRLGGASIEVLADGSPRPMATVGVVDHRAIEDRKSTRLNSSH